MVRILHAADFHLDSAFAALSGEQARARRSESRALLHRMAEYGNDHQVQLMLLGGDLFDSDDVFGQTGEELRDALAAFHGQVVIAPGNHDYVAASSPYSKILWPDNVHIFRRGQMERIDFSQYDCTVYGAAFTAPEETSDTALSGFHADDDGHTVRLGVLHGEVGVRDSRYRPISLLQIEESGLDYLALGHVHSYDGVHMTGSTSYAYAGCPEGRGFDELGEKGFLCGTVDRGSAKLRFVPFALRRYQILSVDVTDRDAREAIERALPLKTEDDIYRMILTGTREDDMNTAALHNELSARFYALELRDETVMRRDIWDKCGDDTLRGLFLQQMRRRYDDGDETQKKQVEQAVRFALDAMDNRE